MQTAGSLWSNSEQDCSFASSFAIEEMQMNQRIESGLSKALTLARCVGGRSWRRRAVDKLVRPVLPGVYRLTLGILLALSGGQAQAQQNALTLSIKDESGLAANPNGFNFYFGSNLALTYEGKTLAPGTWAPFPFSNGGGVVAKDIGIAPGSSSGILQIVLTNTPPPSTPSNASSSAIAGPGYTQLLEFTTGAGSANSTFDISQVNNFSFPVRVETTAAGVQEKLGVLKTVDRAHIYTSYADYISRKWQGSGYGDLTQTTTSLGKKKFGSLSFPQTTISGVLGQRQQLMLNPGQATINGGIGLTNNAIPVNVSDAPLNHAWDQLYTNLTGVNATLYTPKYGSIAASTLKVTPEKDIPASKIFGTSTSPIPVSPLYGPNNEKPTTISPDNIYYNNNSNTKYTGLRFSGIPASTTDAYIPRPEDIAVSLLYSTKRPDLYKINQPPTGTPFSANSATMTVTENDAFKLQPGMFLVNANSYFTNLNGGTRSDVYISAITSDPTSNGRYTLTLSSPGGNILQGGGTQNVDNSQILFANVNDRSYAFSTQQVWFNNAWPLNSNQVLDQNVNCTSIVPNPTPKHPACELANYIGQVKLQVNQAANWGTLAKTPLPTQANPGLLNEQWANVNNWYSATESADPESNPMYNLYSAFWHTQGVTEPFTTNSGITAFSDFGAAYGFQVDENPYQFYPPFYSFLKKPANWPTVQVPSKWDGLLPQGTDLTITLLPWGTTPPPPQPCDRTKSLVCWNAGSGLFSNSSAWLDGVSPALTNPFSRISFQEAFAPEGGEAKNDLKSLSIQGIEYLSGAGSYTLSGNPISITGFDNGTAISNESGTRQIISAPLLMTSTNRLSIFADDASSITLSGGLDSANGWRKTGLGTLELDYRTRGSLSSGVISLARGNLILRNGTDISNYAGISSARDTSISGSGALPGVTSGRFIHGNISPGDEKDRAGGLAFMGNLSLGFGSGVALSQLSFDPTGSDLISVLGNLSIDSYATSLLVGGNTLPSDDSYNIPLLSITDPLGAVTGQFARVIGLSGAQQIVYSSAGTRRGVFLSNNGQTPGDCIQKGDPTSTSNPYSTTLCGGRLKVDSALSATNWTLDNRGENRIDQNGFASPITFSGAFSGAGNLFFENSGLNTGQFINLTGSSSYTGPTFIGLPGGGNPVTLAVNGSISSSASLTVFPGSTIQGNGFLPATNLNPGATIAPGNSIGTLTAAALNLNGGTINAEIQGPQNDRINVTGNVTNFTGTVNLIPFGGGSPFPGFVYTIISAPNSVDFATASSLTLVQPQLTSALLNAGTTLVQNPQGDPKSFAVQWKPNNSTGAVSSAMQALGNGGANASCIAGSLDRAFNALATKAGGNANNTGSLIGTTGFTTGQVAAAGMSTDFFDVLNNLVQLPSTGQLVAAVNSLSPQSYAAFQSVGLDTLKQQREALLAQAGQCLSNGWVINGSKAKKPLCAFGLAQNNTSSIRGTSELSSYNSGVFSGGIGLEYYPSKQWSFGGSYSYGTSYANNFSSSGATVTAGVNSINLFGRFAASDQWRVRALLGYSNFDINGSRSIAFIGNGSSLSANTNANGFTAAIETDYSIPLTKPTAQTQVVIKPLLGLAWGGYQQSGFSESGGPLSLSVASNTAHSFVTTAGLELSTSPIPLNKDKTVSIRPNLLLAYQVDALANNASSKSLNSTFAEASSVCSTCSTQGQSLGTSAFNVAGGLDLQVSQSTSLYLNASYRAYSNASQFGYGGGIRVRF